MAAIGGTTLQPLTVPEGPLTPAWAAEAVRRLNLLTGAQSGNAPVWSFGQNNANLSFPGTGGTINSITQLIEVINAQNIQINLLMAMVQGATIDAVCNGDGTIAVTLTWGS